MTEKKAVPPCPKKDVVKIFSSLQPGLLPNAYMDQLKDMGYVITDINSLATRVLVVIWDKDNVSERFLVILWQIPKREDGQVTDISVYPLRYSQIQENGQNPQQTQKLQLT